MKIIGERQDGLLAVSIGAERFTLVNLSRDIVSRPLQQSEVEKFGPWTPSTFEVDDHPKLLRALRYARQQPDLTFTLDWDESAIQRAADGKFANGDGVTATNSSGQGRSDKHKEHPHHESVTQAGYQYSHSTPVVHPGGDRVLHHTYKFPSEHGSDHSVSLWQGKSGPRWSTSTSSASNHEMTGGDKGSLDKHLKGKSNRHGLYKSTGSAEESRRRQLPSSGGRVIPTDL